MTRFQVVGAPFVITLKEFTDDAQGRKYTDVFASMRVELEAALAVLTRAEVQLRMLDAETHHNRPALAGAIQQIEAHPVVAQLLATAAKNSRDRFKRAIGAAARIVMEGLGWKKTGRKSAIGAGKHFSIAERYEEP
jgi:hypothetical protein